MSVLSSTFTDDADFRRSVLILRYIIRSTFAEVLRFQPQPRIFPIYFIYFLYLVVVELTEEGVVRIFVASWRSESPFK